MQKRMIALAMAALLTLALAGCGENKANTNRPGSDSNNTTSNGANNNGGSDKDNGTVNDGLTDSNGAAGNSRSGRSSYGAYRDKGNDKAFTENRGSTFGRVGEELREDAEQFPPTVWDTMTGNHGASGTATWRQMLDNGFVHDSDGFLLDGENACWS